MRELPSPAPSSSCAPHLLEDLLQRGHGLLLAGSWLETGRGVRQGTAPEIHPVLPRHGCAAPQHQPHQLTQQPAPPLAPRWGGTKSQLHAGLLLLIPAPAGHGLAWQEQLLGAEGEKEEGRKGFATKAASNVPQLAW